MDSAVDTAAHACSFPEGTSVSSPNRTLIVYVDVDDMLIRSVGSKRIPIVPAIEHVRRLHATGAELYCWSSGGGEYARASAQEVGIEQCFRAFLPKPHLLLDDQPVADWKLCIELHPLSIHDQDAIDYWQQIATRMMS
ncbi:hydrolase [Roseateles sp. DB2]|uniref:hydrolase n=1 Tax=Roseateles sp. DB2 TaxID=3453717 RepID=UPI003EEC58C3